MAILDYQIGGNIISQEGGEAILKIPCNRTMIVEQLSFLPPDEPEMVYGIKNMKELFDHFKPGVDLSFKAKSNGADIAVNERLEFRKLEDFLEENIVSRSAYLKSLRKKVDFYSIFLLHLSKGYGLKLDLMDRQRLLKLRENVCRMKDELLMLDMGKSCK